MENFYRRTWAEIDLDALKSNLGIIRGLSGGKEVIAVVKANAYGHGDAAIAKTLMSAGVSRFAVSNLWEAQRLSECGIKGDILIFGYCDIPLVFQNLDKGFIFTVGETGYAQRLSEEAEKRGVRVPVNIKFDTGMSRVGITSGSEADLILSLKGLCCRAGYTHFAAADSLTEDDIAFTEKQQKALTDICAARGLKTHSQNSGGIIYHSGFSGDFVRAGIILYGHKPDSGYPIPEGIKPIFSMKAAVCQIKTVPAGTPVSYGRTFVTERDTRLALIPCGYADGFNRRLSGRWSCLVNGAYAPVAGRICMDQTMLDVTDIPDVKPGDIVTVYSDNTDDLCSLERAAGIIGTISYELLCSVGTRVPRIYTENGKEIEMLRYL